MKTHEAATARLAELVSAARKVAPQARTRCDRATSDLAKGIAITTPPPLPEGCVEYDFATGTRVTQLSPGVLGLCVRLADGRSVRFTLSEQQCLDLMAGITSRMFVAAHPHHWDRP